jgi:hypothetical protein
MTTTGDLSPEQKAELGRILREMRADGATDDEMFEAFQTYWLSHAPIRSYTIFKFPEVS